MQEELRIDALNEVFSVAKANVVLCKLAFCLLGSWVPVNRGRPFVGQRKVYSPRVCCAFDNHLVFFRKLIRGHVLALRLDHEAIVLELSDLLHCLLLLRGLNPRLSVPAVVV